MITDEVLDIIAVNEHFPPDLNVGNLTVPYLAPPEPFGRPNFRDQLFDRVESFLGHIMGTCCCRHSIFLANFGLIGYAFHWPLIWLSRQPYLFFTSYLALSCGFVLIAEMKSEKVTFFFEGNGLYRMDAAVMWWECSAEDLDGSKWKRLHLRGYSLLDWKIEC